MKNKILFVLFAFVLFCCTPPKYIPKKQSELMVMNLDRSITNYIPIIDEDLNRSKILESTYNLIKLKQYAKLKSYINSLEKTGIHSSDFYLSRTLLLITQKNYSEAIIYAKKISDSDYISLKKLLLIDLSYEIAKDTEASDYTEFLKEYQNLIDTYPDDDELKQIVSVRLRYIRYHY
jgi:hypothetical protein